MQNISRTSTDDVRHIDSDNIVLDTAIVKGDFPYEVFLDAAQNPVIVPKTEDVDFEKLRDAYTAVYDGLFSCHVQYADDTWRLIGPTVNTEKKHMLYELHMYWKQTTVYQLKHIMRSLRADVALARTDCARWLADVCERRLQHVSWLGETARYMPDMPCLDTADRVMCDATAILAHGSQEMAPYAYMNTVDMFHRIERPKTAERLYREMHRHFSAMAPEQEACFHAWHAKITARRP